ncbi:MAG: 4Fe-4S dicluster domain-containing protein [bacterium]
MGHISAKLEYQKLRAKVDRYPVGAPATDTMYEILRTLYTPQEAELASRMPLRWSSLGSLSRRFGIPAAELQSRLDTLCDKGLVMDLELSGKMRYILMPTVVGFFEFSMMRIRGDLDQKELARLFHRNFIEESDFVSQFNLSAKTSIFRTLVHEETLPESYTEVLDWERATSLVQSQDLFSVAVCHCRHVAHHQGRECETFPMKDSCLSMGRITDYFVRHGMARRIDRAEALDLLARSRDAGMVHLGDNVQHRASFICNCCGCCCEVLNSYKKWSVFENHFSSNFEARVSLARCTGCKKCQTACPVDAIDMVPSVRQVGKKKVKLLAVIDRDVCIGCGVCKPACKAGSLEMAPRPQRKIAPETLMARMLTMALEQGKLHELMLDRDDGLGIHAANVLLGALLKLPPAKWLLANETLKSRLIAALLSASGAAPSNERKI